MVALYGLYGRHNGTRTDTWQGLQSRNLTLDPGADIDVKEIRQLLDDDQSNSIYNKRRDTMCVPLQTKPLSVQFKQNALSRRGQYQLREHARND
jgi:hypothetical protein